MVRVRRNKNFAFMDKPFMHHVQITVLNAIRRQRGKAGSNVNINGVRPKP